MSDLESYLLSVARGRKGVVPTLLRGVMTGLAPVYVAGLKTYLLPYNLGIRKRKRLPCPVLCIGNITTGGTGKTPMTQTVCNLLKAAGHRVVILSRGYGGSNEYGCAVVSDGQKIRLSAKEAGDEAYLLARTLPDIPIIVGKDRRKTGTLAWNEFQPDVIVLDDGMQYWQLHRDLNIILLNAADPFDNGYTFPRGLLREPPSHLRRAGMIVLTNAQHVSTSHLADLKQTVQRLAPDVPVFTADLAPVGLRAIAGKIEYNTEWLAGRRVAALSAIGNPASFESMIGELGGVLAARFRFRDHQALSLPELEQVVIQACAANAEAIITTEKDAVKMLPLKNKLPVLALQVTMQVEGVNEMMAHIETILHK